MTNVDEEGPIPPCIVKSPYGEYIEFNDVANLFFYCKKLKSMANRANNIIKTCSEFLRLKTVSLDGLEKKIHAWAKKH